MSYEGVNRIKTSVIKLRSYLLCQSTLYTQCIIIHFYLCMLNDLIPLKCNTVQLQSANLQYVLQALSHPRANIIVDTVFLFLNFMTHSG